MLKITTNRLENFLNGFFSPVLQAFRSLAGNYSDKFIFCFIPLAYLLCVTMVHYSFGPFFMGRVDPEYFYMYNGIVVGAGNLSIQYYLHPGTPLHFLIAVTARIIDIFQPGDYMKNFVDDPEKYIHTANLFLNVIVAVIIFICGLYTKKYTRSYPAGLAMQLMPFGSAALISLQGRVFSDSMLIIPLLLIALLIIRHISYQDKTGGAPGETVLFGLLTGFGLACKLTFLPVIVLPLVLLQVSARQKIKLVLYTVMFFIVFAYPVVFNFSDFWVWVSGLFTHSGMYGGGERNFIDIASVPGHLQYLLTNYKALFIISLSSLFLSILFSLKFFINHSISNYKIRRAILAVNLTLLVSLILTLKHFAAYYFVPYTVFSGLLLLLTAFLILSYKPVSSSALYKAVTAISFSVIFLFLTANQVKDLRTQIKYSNQKNAKQEQEYRLVTSLVRNDRPIIMNGPYYGSPFIEFAHHSGFSMTDNMRGFYTSYLKEKFPHSYFYLDWSDKFEFWNDFVNFKDILDKTGSSFYVYIGKECEKTLPEIENRIWNELDKNSVTKKVLYQDTKTGESLIEFILDPGTS